jgi:hypothetical protein
MRSVRRESDHRDPRVPFLNGEDQPTAKGAGQVGGVARHIPGGDVKEVE